MLQPGTGGRDCRICDERTRRIHTPNGLYQYHQSFGYGASHVLIDAEWQQEASEGSNGLYLAEIKYFGNNRTGLLVDITKIFTERGIDINAINSKTSKQGVATISVSFNTKGKMELQSLVDKIRQVESVIDIERTTG